MRYWSMYKKKQSQWDSFPLDLHFIHGVKINTCSKRHWVDVRLFASNQNECTVTEFNYIMDAIH